MNYQEYYDQSIKLLEEISTKLSDIYDAMPKPIIAAEQTPNKPELCGKKCECGSACGITCDLPNGHSGLHANIYISTPK